MNEIHAISSRLICDTLLLGFVSSFLSILRHFLVELNAVVCRSKINSVEMSISCGKIKRGPMGITIICPDD